MMMAQPPRHPLLLPPFLLLLLLLHLYCPAQADRINALDLAALREIRDDLTDLPGTDFFSTWDFTSPDPCSDFAGVTCSGEPPRVTILTLGTGLSASPGLAGSLSPSLSKLTQLTQLVLFPGIVTGPIPPELGRLTQLRVLSLTNNRLTGPIPTSISALRNLHTLDLSSNQLTGPLPSSLSGLSQLKVLVLASNRLSGELPKSLPAQLLHLDLKNNGFWGRLPLRLPEPLRYLSASGNQMWGPLNGLQSLSSELVYLDLSMNRFSGPIPASLFRSTLSSMLLQRNNLSGGLPPSSSSSPSYGPGSVVDLSHNSLGGEISTVLAGAESVFLNNNRLMGRVPVEYIDAVRRGSTRTLYLQHNYLTGFPVEGGLPDSASVCLAYNCMVPLVGLATCPASAGGQLSRPMNQCPVFNHNDSSTG
ncbi:LRR receptor-like serine/threonine-protein kinase ER1 [Diospyros lotus]|uniref:LRR receptor-like serine/threonine-protein kinase ER1 n=1 Tax=Diospyros lotus TaxID=55363 RepID=UPI002258C294|nr:LRR receptor-like serine/threonine-protein kinase ER1 [Diospyros lotus]